MFDDFWWLALLLIVLMVPAAFAMLIVLLVRQSRNQAALEAAVRRVEEGLAANQAQLLRLAEKWGTPETLPAAVPAEEALEPPVELESAPDDEPTEAEASAWDESPLPSWDFPREPGRFEQAAREILAGIWNWIVVGEEHRPSGVSMEYAIASNWLLRIGVVILVTGIAFFLKYSIDNGLLGEQARVALALLAGAGMVAGGTRLLGKTYHLFGQGLLGGGIAVLYFGVFAAFAFYHLIGVLPAFALMALVTLGAGALAVRLDSMLVAIFGIVGGYATPILLSTGQKNFPGLFAYLLLLGLGTLGANYYKKWHLLNYLSFAGTYLLFFGAMGQYQVEDFWQVLPFLAAFFALYSSLVFFHCLVRRSPSNLLDLLGLLANAGIFFTTAYVLVDEAYGWPWPAVLALALTAFYLAHAYYCLARRLLDQAMLLSFTGLAAFFATLTLPLLLSERWLTVSWSILALVLLWIAGSLRSEFLRQAAYALYGLVLLRFGFHDLALQYGAALPADAPLLDFLPGLLERLVCFGTPIASLALAYRLLQQQPAPIAGLAYEAATDVRPWLVQSRSQAIAVAAGVGLLFLFLQLELYHSLGYLYPPLRPPLLTALWLGLGLFLLRQYLAAPGPWLSRLLWLCGAALLAKLALFDLPGWNLVFAERWAGGDGWTLWYGGTYAFLPALMRLLDFAAAIAFFGFAWLRLARGADAGLARRFFGGSALVLLFVFLSLEVNSALGQYVPGLRSGGVTMLWSLFGLGLVLAGIGKNLRALRLAGLALFAVVAWKVFFVDLAHLDPIYRIVAFIVLGLLALGGAFAYMKYRQVFTEEATP